MTRQRASNKQFCGPWADQLRTNSSTNA